MNISLVPSRKRRVYGRSAACATTLPFADQVGFEGANRLGLIFCVAPVVTSMVKVAPFWSWKASLPVFDHAEETWAPSIEVICFSSPVRRSCTKMCMVPARSVE